MKRKISKVEYEALVDALKAHYKADGDDYVLNLVDDAENDPAELRRALIRERDAAKTAKEQKDALQAKLDAIPTDAARKAGDIATLEASYKQKLIDQQKESDAKLSKANDFIRKVLVENKAITLATKLAGDDAEILLPHITKRLQADTDGETPTTRVLDADGKVSAFTLEDLEKEFVANKKFSGIIIGSKGSGGAGSSKGNKAGLSTVLKDKKFNELNDVERTQLLADVGKEKFKEMAEAARRVF